MVLTSFTTIETKMYYRGNAGGNMKLDIIGRQDNITKDIIGGNSAGGN
jgi:hypothetical protein